MLKKQHIGVYGLITKDNQILLIKKSRGPYTGMYDLPGGSFEHGETIDDCLRREIKEETGMVVKNYEWFDNYTAEVEYIENNEEKSMHHIGMIYNITDFDLADFNKNIQDEDVNGADLFDINTIDNSNVSSFVNLIIKTLNK